MEEEVSKQKYTFEAWIHPKDGGDDKCLEVDITATSLEGAKQFLEKWLSKRSSGTTDYKLLKET